MLSLARISRVFVWQWTNSNGICNVLVRRSIVSLEQPLAQERHLALHPAVNLELSRESSTKSSPIFWSEDGEGYNYRTDKIAYQRQEVQIYDYAF